MKNIYESTNQNLPEDFIELFSHPKLPCSLKSFVNEDKNVEYIVEINGTTETHFNAEEAFKDYCESVTCFANTKQKSWKKKLDSHEKRALRMLFDACAEIGKVWNEKLGNILEDLEYLGRDLHEMEGELEFFLDRGEIGTREYLRSEECNHTPFLVSCQHCKNGRQEDGSSCDTCGGSSLVSDGEPGSEGYCEA